jgi:hypothetical protein
MSATQNGSVPPVPPGVAPVAVNNPVVATGQGVSSATQKTQAVVVTPQQKKPQQQNKQQKKQQQQKKPLQPVQIAMIAGLLVLSLGFLGLGIYLTFKSQKKVTVTVTKVETNSYTFTDKNSKKHKVNSKNARFSFKVGNKLTRYRFGNLYLQRKSPIITLLGAIIMILFPLAIWIGTYFLYQNFVKK